MLAKSKVSMADESITDQNSDEQPKSKSQIKRDFLEFQSLAKQLIALSPKHLTKTPLSDATKEAVIEARYLTKGAMSRQVKYIGNLMPNEDAAAIRLSLDKLRQGGKEKSNAFHEVEQWRDRLLQGDQKLLEDLAARFENFERQYTNQLIRNAKKEQQLNKPPKSARLLFKYLADLQGSG